MRVSIALYGIGVGGEHRSTEQAATTARHFLMWHLLIKSRTWPWFVCPVDMHRIGMFWPTLHQTTVVMHAKIFIMYLYPSSCVWGLCTNLRPLALPLR